ncbi:hypothetical protein F383_27455 [Gossypium arboreum]|uniref:Uncharacterized protein n=1 Tax=Gossypium arboreum TaxID=29729 RepID=A0A0B0MWP1_GOSAR|nr:hypothetical protein F383_28432 [Gossypium arboreum]KHG21970.1 hypothetical protein F383_27455 [Gossypium arboreum]
MFRIQLTNL